MFQRPGAVEIGKALVAHSHLILSTMAPADTMPLLTYTVCIFMFNPIPFTSSRASDVVLGLFMHLIDWPVN
jgi:hypothetical protein